MPALLLKLSKVEIKQQKKVNIEKVYSKVSGKNAVLLKSYSANYTRILAEALTDQNLKHVEHFFISGPDVVKCLLPYKTYLKKLAFACSKITVMYSKLE